MTEVLLYIWASFGLMCILKYGSILSFVRTPLVARFNFFDELFQCSLCLGFWTGVTLGVFLYYTGKWDPFYFLFPLLSAPACWTLDSLVGIVKYKEVALQKEKK